MMGIVQLYHCHYRSGQQLSAFSLSLGDVEGLRKEEQFTGAPSVMMRAAGVLFSLKRDDVTD
jgi:hypothetical protein